jgi:DNA-binding LacI/PurR family transcriptional regulator
MATTLSPHDVRRVAVAAGCDPRTVLRRLAGARQPCTTRARVDAALRELGLTSPAASATAAQLDPATQAG